jgi:hypothetical protein
MEFVDATFPTQRRVRVDGAVRGQTNQVIRLQAGTHSFDLDTPKDYTPSIVVTQVIGTTQASPMIITFTPIAAAVAAKAKAIPATGAKASAAGRKRAAKRKTTGKKKGTKGKKKAKKQKRAPRKPQRSKKAKAARKVR